MWGRKLKEAEEKCMEKDYFMDRPPQCQERKFFSVGNEAFICLKSVQKTAKVLSDLTRIKIDGILTPQDNHPRGIKLKGTAFQRDLYGNILVNSDLFPIKSEAIGRCTYPFLNGKVLTKDNKMNILYSGGLRLVETSQIGDRYNISISFESSLIKFGCIINPYCYYKKCEIPSIINSIDFKNTFIDGTYCYISINNSIIAAPMRHVEYKTPYISSINAVFETEKPSLSRFIKVSAVSWCGILE